MVLSRLEQVSLRDIWKTEDQDFTPWLAQPENLQILGETLKIELELEAVEENVGPFRADILCKDASQSNEEAWVLVENQLEQTDHKHLGQLMTYAAGLSTVTIIWVASEFRNEHKAALDWLNEVTEDGLSFFGLEIELWKIGDSPPAPKFNIISKPNDWTRSVTKAKRVIDGELSETRANYLDYWTQLNEFMNTQNSPIKLQTPRPNHWTQSSIGKSGFHINPVATSRDKWQSVELYISNSNPKLAFHELLKDKSEIESELGYEVDWQELPEKKSSRIRIRRDGVDPYDKESWEDQFKWFQIKIEEFHKVFKNRVAKL